MADQPHLLHDLEKAQDCPVGHDIFSGSHRLPDVADNRFPPSPEK